MGRAVSVEPGKPFTLMVGVKCSSGCDMTGHKLTVQDQEGRDIRQATLSGEIAPGTAGLYQAAIELIAPETEGMDQWKVVAAPHDTGHGHDSVAASFGLRTVAPAEFSVRIEAVDCDGGAPLKNMSVVMHPYRARTDTNGVAEIKVARGTYSVFVSGRGYFPVRREMVVDQDITTRASLETQPEQSRDW